MHQTGFEPHNLSTRATADLRLRKRGNRDQLLAHMEAFNCCYAEIKN
jgi:hypothetical protein